MDYSNGKIYTIRSYQTDKYYIGSTTTSLAKRLSDHKSKYKSGRMDISSVEIVKYEDAYIELLEDYPCCSKNDLNKREGQLIRQYKNECVNRCIPGRTINNNKKEYDYPGKDNKKKYYEANKDVIKEKRRLYRIENREQINQRDRERYKQKNNIDIV
jgi:hypothetical protein